eukprot:CFRG5268T1
MTFSVDSLKTEWGKSNPDLSKVGQILAQAKIALLSIQISPGSSLPSLSDMVLARDVLEIGALYSNKVEDSAAFERYFLQLKTYYFDLNDQLTESSNKWLIVGMNLMRLLAYNELSLFHTELEVLDPKVLHDVNFVAYPVALEQYLIEGSYNRIFKAKSDLPSHTFSFFFERLAVTVRMEIAQCCERAFLRLPFAEARKLLFLDSDTEAKALAEKLGWVMEGSSYSFKVPEKIISKASIQSDALVEKTMGLALELERIV